jgi:tRNA(Ile)-lysidine synthase
MLDKVEKYIRQNDLFLKKDKLLLGLSGGRDSMVLLDVLIQLGYQVAAAHCNFNLRGDESDAETEFVKMFCEKRQVKCHVKYFDTDKVSLAESSSTQLTARSLRYCWFEEVRLRNKFDKVLTAHHLDDQIETFLINLTRGTGLKGLTGIPVKRGEIVRPMLEVSREGINTYAKKNNLEFKDDSSNDSDAYLRNRIRHKLVPQFKKSNPSFSDTFNRTINNLKLVQSFWEKCYVAWKEKVDSQNEVSFIVDEIIRSDEQSFLTFYLHEKGFSYSDIDVFCLNSYSRQSGSVLLARDYRLIYDRGKWILTDARLVQDDKVFRVDAANLPIDLLLKEVVYDKTLSIPTSSSTAWIDKSKINGELHLRRWKQGDYFIPLGMSNKKKLSDYFIDNKLSLADKERIWLLCDEKSIIWIVGNRLDNRFRITNKTKELIEVKVELKD